MIDDVTKGASGTTTSVDNWKSGLHLKGKYHLLDQSPVAPLIRSFEEELWIWSSRMNEWMSVAFLSVFSETQVWPCRRFQRQPLPRRSSGPHRAEVCRRPLVYPRPKLPGTGIQRSVERPQAAWDKGIRPWRTCPRGTVMCNTCDLASAGADATIRRQLRIW